MIALLTEIWGIVTDIWATGNRWARWGLTILFGWPIVAIAAGMVLNRTYMASVALLIIIGAVFLTIARVSPLVVAILAANNRGRVLLQFIRRVVAIELLIVLYLVLVPVENARGLVPVFILTAITLVLFMDGRAPAYVSLIRVLLTGLIALYTVWFCVAPYFNGVKTNPVPGWAYWVVVGIALVAVVKLRGPAKYAAAILLIIAGFAGWQRLYPGASVEVPRIVRTAIGDTASGRPRPESGMRYWPLDTTFVVDTTWTECLRVGPGNRGDIHGNELASYEVETEDTVYRFTPDSSDVIVRRPGCMRVRSFRPEGDTIYLRL